MTGTTLDWQKHCKAEFKEYCEVHEEHFPLNNINDEKTRRAIYLVPTANFQVRYTFICLTTGHCITRKQFSVVPMHASIFNRMEELATIDKKTDEELTFEDQSNNQIPNEYTDDIIEGAVTAVFDEGGANTMSKMATELGIKILGVGYIDNITQERTQE